MCQLFCLVLNLLEIAILYKKWYNFSYEYTSNRQEKPSGLRSQAVLIAAQLQSG